MVDYLRQALTLFAVPFTLSSCLHPLQANRYNNNSLTYLMLPSHLNSYLQLPYLFHHPSKSFFYIHFLTGYPTQITHPPLRFNNTHSLPHQTPIPTIHPHFLPISHHLHTTIAPIHYHSSSTPLPTTRTQLHTSSHHQSNPLHTTTTTTGS